MPFYSSIVQPTDIHRVTFRATQDPPPRSLTSRRRIIVHSEGATIAASGTRQLKSELQHVPMHSHVMHRSRDPHLNLTSNLSIFEAPLPSFVRLSQTRGRFGRCYRYCHRCSCCSWRCQLRDRMNRSIGTRLLLCCLCRCCCN